MITRKIEYWLPATAKEARSAFEEAESAGKAVHYYSGGTEINSFTRKFKMAPDILIDLKGIPDLMDVKSNTNTLIIGSCMNLNQVMERLTHPCVTTSLKGIADHTTRNHITLGGNLCGRLPYREAALPFMLIEGAKVHVQTQNGCVTHAFNSLFQNRVLLEKGDFITGLEIPDTGESSQWLSIRKTKAGKIDYPLIHVEAHFHSNHTVDLATSGYFSFPSVHHGLLYAESAPESMAARVLSQLEGKVKNDGLASMEYREHLMKLALIELLTERKVNL